MSDTAEATAVRQSGIFTPHPGAAPWLSLVRSHGLMELRLILRNGEQLLLNLIIPVLLTVVLVLEPFIDIGHGRRPAFFVPGILALAVMSAAFTGQAIATGFERKYGVLKRLGVTPLPRSALLTGKTAAVACLEVLQVGVICAVGIAVGWHPHGSPLPVILLIVLGTAAFGGLAMLIAGTLRAEATLAAANLVWFVLLFCGDVLFPLSKFPHVLADVLLALPTAALANGLRLVLRNGQMFPGRDVLTLAIWAVVGLWAASRFFRWE